MNRQFIKLPNFGSKLSAPGVAGVAGADGVFDADAVDDFLSTLWLEVCDADDALLAADGVGLGMRLRS